jgi:hypothetical protein
VCVFVCKMPFSTGDLDNSAVYRPSVRPSVYVSLSSSLRVWSRAWAPPPPLSRHDTGRCTAGAAARRSRPCKETGVEKYRHADGALESSLPSTRHEVKFFKVGLSAKTQNGNRLTFEFSTQHMSVTFRSFHWKDQSTRLRYACVRVCMRIYVCVCMYVLFLSPTHPSLHSSAARFEQARTPVIHTRVSWNV